MRSGTFRARFIPKPGMRARYALFVKAFLCLMLAVNPAHSEPVKPSMLLAVLLEDAGGNASGDCADQDYQVFGILAPGNIDVYSID